MMKIPSLAGLSALGLTAILAGCAMPRQQPQQQIITRQIPMFQEEKPKVIKSDVQPFRKVERANLTIDNRDVSQDSARGIVTIRGKAYAVCDITKWEAWGEFPAGAGEPFPGDKRIVVKNTPKRTKTETFTPSSLEVSISGIASSQAAVQREGSFIVQIQDPKFVMPAQRPYYQVMQRERSIEVKIPANSNAPAGASFSPVSLGNGKEYFLQPNNGAVEKFVNEKINSQIYSLVIGSRDKVSRTAVSSKLEVECTDAPDLLKLIRDEIPEELREKAYGLVKKHLAKGDKYSDSGQAVVIPVIRGGTYKFQVTHPAYHFLQATAAADGKTTKLFADLIEKGAKVRVDNTPEGTSTLSGE